MSNQKKKNINLIIVAAILIGVVIANAFLFRESEDNSGLNRDLFKVANTRDINKVVAEKGGETTLLEYKEGQWRLNDSHLANPLNVKLLFATIREMTIRREIENEEQKQELLSKINHEGKNITFYANGDMVTSCKIWGDAANSTSYAIHPSEPEKVYLLEIPGYRAFIYGLTAVAYPEWKHPAILHAMNWRNLSTIDVAFPQNPDSSFSIAPQDGFYAVEGLVATDTSKLISYIDYLSLLEVDRYLLEYENPDTTQLLLNITMRDVGNNPTTLKLWRQEESPLWVGGVDGKNWFILSPEKTKPLNKGKNYFLK